MAINGHRRASLECPLLGVARFWALLLSGLVLAIGYLMVAFTQEKTGLHDLICNTRVVHGRR